MAKRGRKKGSGRKPVVEEQLQLIDVGPENLKEIAPIAREYRTTLKEKRKLLAKEVELKAKLHELIKVANLNRLPDGNIRFTCEGLLIIVKYRDELIQVKEQKEKTSEIEKSMQQTVEETEAA